MNEGEKKNKKVYKRGDIVTFRLLKKYKLSDAVLELLNSANETNSLNVEILEALELYAKHKKHSSISEEIVVESIDKSISKEVIIEDEAVDEIFKVVITEPDEENRRFQSEVAFKSNIDEANEEIFSDINQTNKEKNGLNRAFKGLRRNI